MRTGCAIQESRGPLHNLLLHELGHAIGFNGGNTHKFFRTPVAEHCVTHLPEDKTINGAVCVHEVEAVLAGYGLVQYSVTDSSFAHTPFVTNSALPLQSATLEIGQTTTLTPGALALELGGVVSGTENAYTWSTSAIGVASVSTTGVVTAASAGTATIRATPTHGTGYFLAHPFRTTGRTATITVQGPPPPPPPPPFQVDSIGTDQMPITLATHHLFSARVLSPPSGSLSTVWIITDSRTPTVSDTVTVSGNTLSRFVEAGSYTLSFTVRPTVGSTSGFAASQGIPVCAAPSTDLWGGGGSTEATPGCEEYQQ